MRRGRRRPALPPRASRPPLALAFRGSAGLFFIAGSRRAGPGVSPRPSGERSGAKGGGAARVKGGRAGSGRSRPGQRDPRLESHSAPRGGTNKRKITSPVGNSPRRAHPSLRGCRPAFPGENSRGMEPPALRGAGNHCTAMAPAAAQPCPRSRDAARKRKKRWKGRGSGESPFRRARGSPGRDGHGGGLSRADKQGGISEESPDLCSFHICVTLCVGQCLLLPL